MNTEIKELYDNKYLLIHCDRIKEARHNELAKETALPVFSLKEERRLLTMNEEMVRIVMDMKRWFPFSEILGTRPVDDCKIRFYIEEHP